MHGSDTRIQLSAATWQAQDPNEPLRQLRQQIKWVAVLGGALAGGLTAWERFFPIPADQLVTVYFTHSCRCFGAWTKSLKADGLIVRTIEPETLQPTRAHLNMPAGLWGCHVAFYLGYFVEGHVPASALRKLAAE